VRSIDKPPAREEATEESRAPQPAAPQHEEPPDLARLDPALIRAPASPAAVSAGLQPLGLAAGRDGLLYLPPRHEPAHPAPLAVVLHGAGSGAAAGAALLRDLADDAGLVLLALDSRGPTWDLIRGGYGPDVRFLRTALAHVSARIAIDRRRVAIGGFSDGASYALSLGLTNGDLFNHIVAFSPGFLAPSERRGRPLVFIAHGVRDRVLPIDRCSRRIVPSLREAGYQVRYREFDGGHEVPPPIAHEAVDFLRYAAR
jgi:phospholipase/carboxylesterase